MLNILDWPEVMLSVLPWFPDIPEARDTFQSSSSCPRGLVSLSLVAKRLSRPPPWVHVASMLPRRMRSDTVAIRSSLRSKAGSLAELLLAIRVNPAFPLIA